jgi:hypothetical protein
MWIDLESDSNDEILTKLALTTLYFCNWLTSSAPLEQSILLVSLNRASLISAQSEETF